MQVCGIVGQVQGVRLADLVAQLPHRAPDGQAAMDEVLALARALPAHQAPGLDRHLRVWGPVISALVAATGTAGDAATTPASIGTGPGDDTAGQDAAAFLDQALDHYAGTRDWAALTAALRRVRAGERDPAVLAEGLDEIDTAILTRALAALDGTDPIDPTLWTTPTDATTIPETPAARGSRDSWPRWPPPPAATHRQPRRSPPCSTKWPATRAWPGWPAPWPPSSPVTVTRPASPKT